MAEDIDLWFVLLAFFGAGCFIGGMVTALKARWVWFAIGFLTGGILWAATGFLLARPDSAWARSFYSLPKLARARRKFTRQSPG